MPYFVRTLWSSIMIDDFLGRNLFFIRILFLHWIWIRILPFIRTMQLESPLPKDTLIIRAWITGKRMIDFFGRITNSGKTSLTNKIRAQLPGCLTICQDSYFLVGEGFVNTYSYIGNFSVKTRTPAGMLSISDIKHIACHHYLILSWWLLVLMTYKNFVSCIDILNCLVLLYKQHVSYGKPNVT